jgi:hypothetical protein
MSDIRIDIPDITVVIDKGEVYNVNIERPNIITTLDDDNYIEVADFAFSSVSSSYALTASYVEGDAGITDWTEITNIPNGLVSSSTQVDYTQIQNQPTLIASASFALTASYVSGAASVWDDVADKPEGLVSSSNQIVEYNIFATTGSNTFISSQIVDGNITADNFFGTASIAENVTVINAGFFETSSESYIIPAPGSGISYITSASYSLTASYALNADITPTWSNIADKPSGLISSSAQISQSGFVSSSTVNVIQTITSASYAAIAPVSGTLYILIG